MNLHCWELIHILKSHVAQLLEIAKFEYHKILNIYDSAFLFRKFCFLYSLKMLFSQMLYTLLDVLQLCIYATQNDQMLYIIK